MYFGSVKFFKHVIICIICLCVLIPTILSVAFSVQNQKLVAKNAEITEQFQNQGIALQQAETALLEKQQGQSQMLAPAGESAESVPEKDPSAAREPSFDYQAFYPELYCEASASFVKKDKTLYLTFDDGPSDLTEKILDILDEQEVKATFFVVGKDSEQGRENLRKIVERGHEVGIHTYSHNYRKIYASVNSFLEDFYEEYQWVYETCGVKATIYRFPGGSINAYNQLIYKEIIAEMARRGFTYYDWNLSGEDAVKGSTAQKVKDNLLNRMSGVDRGIILLHDGHSQTVEVLGEVISALKKDGYTFEPLTNEVEPITFPYID